MSDHPVLAAQPEWEAWIQEGQQIARQRDALGQQILAAQAKNTKAEEEYRRAVDAAIAECKPVPNPPDLVQVDHLSAALQRLRDAEIEHQQRRNSVLAVVADRVIEGGSERLRVLQGNAIPHVEALEKTHDDVRSTLRLIGDVMNAQDQADGLVVHPSRSERLRHDLSLDDLAFAVVNDLQLDALTPGPGSERRVELDTSGLDFGPGKDVGHQEALDLQRRNTHYGVGMARLGKKPNPAPGVR